MKPQNRQIRKIEPIKKNLPADEQDDKLWHSFLVKVENKAALNSPLGDLCYEVFRQLQKVNADFLKENDVCQLFGSSLSFHLFFKLAIGLQENQVFIFLDERSAERVYSEVRHLCQYFGVGQAEDRLVWMPSNGILPFMGSVPSGEKQAARSKALASILRSAEQKKALFASLETVLTRVVDKQLHQQHNFDLKIGDEISLQQLRERLFDYGFEYADMVEAPGQFSIRGGIVDIFSDGYFNPVRLDMFGDRIDQLRFFDPLTQKSVEDIKNYQITLQSDVPFRKPDFREKLAELKNSNEDYAKIPLFDIELSALNGLWDILPKLFATSSIFEYFNGSYRCCLIEKNEILAKVEKLIQEYGFLRGKNRTFDICTIDELFLTVEEFSQLTTPAYAINNVAHLPSDDSYGFFEPPQFKGRISMLAEKLQGEVFKNKKIFLISDTVTQQDRLKHILSSFKDLTQPLNFLTSSLRDGFSHDKILVLTEKELFGKSLKNVRLNKNTSQIIESFIDLREGDHVVHVNYGIGRFSQLKRMKVAGHERDFLELIFAGNDKLFVPLEQLSLIHRYIGNSENPVLDHLGKKSSWEKTKARVKESVESMAQELIELYARRENLRGFSFPPDSVFQEEFEAQFPYEETEHQMAAIYEVKKDMESERPLDRLICGDVGYGKTEVAIRAAFKAVMAGKQVAILCPTTVLALQHFNTFTKRFADFPVKVDYISRFKTSAGIRKAKEELKEGKIDVIIATHALLAKDVEFKNLGLLVIDEEQRFGVSHKEKIKKIRANIDCLTMTATPIPRTLQMSLTGIRDLSIIETPPRNRIKIETYVLEESDEVIRLAIKNELARQGQVYILHNQVSTIDAQAGRIKSIFPQARVGILHGQMPEDQIEEIMTRFYEYEFDVLVATTIIESGIDIPNVNTLMVMNSQRFGLSQLYQIKGRVGRSDRQAYAYFFYPHGISVTEIASKRLNTLQEYDELGAGFKIAMRDLEIRGAGNILGKEQSGDIMEVGFELYVRFLQDKLAELKHEEKEYFDTSIIVNQDFFFPDDYIKDTRQKMEFYKKIASCTSLEEIAITESELYDRFGQPPLQVVSMLRQEKIRVLANLLHIEKIEWKGHLFYISASPTIKINTDKFKSLLENDNRFSVDNNDIKTIIYKPHSKILSEALHEIQKILEYLD